MQQPRILVHLGASDVPEQFREASVEWVRKAVQLGTQIARQGAKAEDIVAATVSILEDSPVSDAGFGSVFNDEGGHQMDAGIMTGNLQYGAILSVHGIRNPIQLARKMVDDPRFSILCGKGAMKFAKQQGFEILPDEKFETVYNRFIQDEYSGHCDPLDLFVQPPDHGTVGCVCMDIYGNIAAGTSTGGTPFAPLGRVGDSPFPGCGVYANDAQGCCSCTGYGEAILVERLGAKTAERLPKMPAMTACKEAIKLFAKSPRHVGGVICIKKENGEYGLFHNTMHMPFAFLNEDGTIEAHLAMNELQN